LGIDNKTHQIQVEKTEDMVKIKYFAQTVHSNIYRL